MKNNFDEKEIFSGYGRGKIHSPVRTPSHSAAKHQDVEKIDVSTSAPSTPIFTSASPAPSSKRGLSTINPDPTSHTVDWDAPSDPANPLNWSKRRRWTAILIMSAITFITPFASSMVAPGVPQIMAEFHNDSTELAAFVVSVFLIGYVFGPFLVAPISEMYGRAIILNVTNVLFVVFTIASAVSPNLGLVIFFRFAMGFCAAAPLTVGGGVVADVTRTEERGLAISVWIMGPVIGPAIGPVVGGFLVEAKGWRWTFWVLAIISAVTTLICLLFYHETYAPTLLSRKAARLRKETGNLQLRSVLDNGQTSRQVFATAIYRPPKLLFLSPVVAVMALDVAIAYGYLYLLFTTFTYVFEETYNFNPGQAGLTYLAFGCGNFLALLIYSWWSDHIVKVKSAKTGKMTPEMRLPPLVPGAIIMPIGLFLYGWSANYRLHWMVSLVGEGIYGFGMLFTWMTVQSYVVDAFPLYAASASAALAISRSVFGAVLPLAGQKMYAALGLGWGNSLLAFVAVALIPLPFLFIRYGEWLRTSPRFRLEL